MTAGRPPGTGLLDSADKLTAACVVSVDGRGRLAIPRWLAAEARWLGTPSTSHRTALGVMDAPGHIRLLDWTVNSVSVLERAEHYISSGELELLRTLLDRYLRIEIGSDLRLTLSPPAIAHLFTADPTPATVYLYRIADVLEVETTSYRAERLRRVEAVFGDLP